MSQRQPLTPEQIELALSSPDRKAEYDHLRREYGQAAGDRYLEVCVYPATNSGQKQGKKRGAA